MQAIILAAGMGRRLKEHTKDKTKCMVEVGGQTLIERTLRILDTEGLSRIVVVAGYQAGGADPPCGRAGDFYAGRFCAQRRICGDQQFVFAVSGQGIPAGGGFAGH